MRATVPLAIGFPRMQLSDGMLARLRAASQTTATSPAGAGRRVRSSIRDCSSKRIGTAKTKRQLPPRRGRAAICAAISRPEIRLDTLQELFPEAGHRVLPWNDLERASEPALEEPSLATASMLSFQQTMQAFLETQQEVMTAYLEPSGEALVEGTVSAFESLHARPGTPESIHTEFCRDGDALPGVSPRQAPIRFLVSRPARLRGPGAERSAGSNRAGRSRRSSSWKPMTIRSLSSTRWAAARSPRSTRP